MASSLLWQEADEEDVRLYFVLPLNLTEEECDNDMKEAFKNSAKNDLDPSWKAEESCLALSPSKRDVFVFQKFEGPAFEHLKEFKCVIVGPRCLNHGLLNQLSIPHVNHPTFTAAMRDLYVTCSGGGVDAKKDIKEKVELMSGTYTKAFNEKTTHVVVSSVTSSKYEKALELGIPVRTHSWVNAVWQRSLKEYVLATDEIFNEYKCPPFLHLNVCTTGLIIREQERIKNTVIKYGGTYDSSLSPKINVLVVKNPKGPKFHHAQLWKIPCVEPKWIDDSVQNGHALPTKSYEVKGNRAASSPKKDSNSVTFSADVSNIMLDSRNTIDETAMNCSTSSVLSFCPPKIKTPVKMPPPAPVGTPVKTPGELKHLLSDLSLNQTKKAGSFLDGCGVYLLGWSSEEEETLKKILKCSGAARFSDLSDRVSHVLVGNLEKSSLRILKGLPHKPHVVNIKWLIQSVIEKSPATEEPFSCMPKDNLNVTEAPSPLSKKGMALLQRGNFSPQKPPSSQNQNVKDTSSPSPNKGKSLLAKYMSSDPCAQNILSTSAIAMPPPSAPANKAKISHVIGNATRANDDSDVIDSQDSEMFFIGKKFVIVGLAEEAADYVENELIRKHGGEVVSNTYKGVLDYAVVPLTGTTLHQTATEIITSLWLETCIEHQAISPMEYYHQPVVLDIHKKPLEGFVLGLSGFCGKERQFILELATALGALCQDVFAKRSKGNARASSHLICKTSEESEKYKAAIKWCRPAVYHTWLLACANSGSHVPETPYLLDPSQILKPLENANSTVSSNVSPASADVTGLKKSSCFKTPERLIPSHDPNEVQRWLNYVPSPYGVATPPVPIGLSENPTPGESKRMLKIIEKLPEKEERPLPPKRNSTPLHELRRRIIAKCAETPESVHQDTSNPVTPITDELTSHLNTAEGRSDSSLKSNEPACSTPNQGSSSGTCRKLLDFRGSDISSATDGNLDKLKKLIATPEVKDENSSPKISGLNQFRCVGDSEKQQCRVFDSLKVGSQPYAIQWEDPVNLKRSLKEDEPEEETSKRRSSENPEREPPAKRKSSEKAEEEPPTKIKSSENGEGGHLSERRNSTTSYEMNKACTETVGAASKSREFKFHLSHVGAKEPYASIIRKLGGTLLDTTNYNSEATHLLLEKNPQRSEKLLAFIASGKWVLHISYLEASEKQGKFVEESAFEWGNPQNEYLSLVKPGSVEEALSKAAYRWRTTLAETNGGGAFKGFKCKILTSSGKAVAFVRLVEAGGGKVLPANSEETPSLCFINVSTHNGSIREYAKLGIPCLPLSYLYEHLTVYPTPNPESRALDEYKKLREKYTRQM